MDIAQYNYDTLIIDGKWANNDPLEANILALNTLISSIKTPNNTANKSSMTTNRSALLEQQKLTSRVIQNKRHLVQT